MKLLVIFAAVLFSTVAAHQDLVVNIGNLDETLNKILGDFKVDLPPEILQQLNAFATHELSLEDNVGYVTAILNDFIDKTFDNLRNLLEDSNADTVILPNIALKLDSNGELNLTNGMLQDIGSLKRNGDVVVQYGSEVNIITLTLPLQFDDIKYSFDYQAKVLIISPHGGFHGQIQNVKVDVVLSFNFNTDQVSLDHYDMNDTGKISIVFTGNDLLDWLIDAISAVVTATLHPLLVDVLQKEISNIITNVVGGINEAIDGVLHPTPEAIL